MIIPNGAVVREKRTTWHEENEKRPMKGVVISQTEQEDRVVVRYAYHGEWIESVHSLTVLDEKPVQDGTRTYG